MTVIFETNILIYELKIVQKDKNEFTKGINQVWKEMKIKKKNGNDIFFIFGLNFCRIKSVAFFKQWTVHAFNLFGVFTFLSTYLIQLFEQAFFYTHTVFTGFVVYFSSLTSVWNVCALNCPMWALLFIVFFRETLKYHCF